MVEKDRDSAAPSEDRQRGIPIGAKSPQIDESQVTATVYISCPRWRGSGVAVAMRGDTIISTTGKVTQSASMLDTTMCRAHHAKAYQYQSDVKH